MLTPPRCPPGLPPLQHPLLALCRPSSNLCPWHLARLLCVRASPFLEKPPQQHPGPGRQGAAPHSRVPVQMSGFELRHAWPALTLSLLYWHRSVEDRSFVLLAQSPSHAHGSRDDQCLSQEDFRYHRGQTVPELPAGSWGGPGLVRHGQSGALTPTGLGGLL